MSVFGVKGPVLPLEPNDVPRAHQNHRHGLHPAKGHPRDGDFAQPADRGRKRVGVAAAGGDLGDCRHANPPVVLERGLHGITLRAVPHAHLHSGGFARDHAGDANRHAVARQPTRVVARAKRHRLADGGQFAPGWTGKQLRHNRATPAVPGERIAGVIRDPRKERLPLHTIGEHDRGALRPWPDFHHGGDALSITVDVAHPHLIDSRVGLGKIGQTQRRAGRSRQKLTVFPPFVCHHAHRVGHGDTQLKFIALEEPTARRMVDQEIRRERKAFQPVEQRRQRRRLLVVAGYGSDYIRHAHTTTTGKGLFIAAADGLPGPNLEECTAPRRHVGQFDRV